MAATTNPLSYSDWKFYIGANVLEGLQSATGQYQQNLNPTVDAAPDQWRDVCKGIRGWGFTVNGGWNEGTDPECGIGATLSWDGGTTDHKGVMDMTLNVDVTMMALTSQSSAGQREARPGRISTSIDFTAWYYDPAATDSNWSAYMDNVRAGTGTLTVQVDFGTGSTVSFSAHADSLDISRADDEHVQISGSAQATGEVTDTTAGATALAAVMTALFGQSSVTAKATTDSTDDTEWTGTCYISSGSISIPVEGAITYDFSLQGTGAITEQAVPV